MRILQHSPSLRIPQRTTLIVVPCFNEEARLDRLEFIRFARQTSAIRFVLVNDGSTDNTASLLGDLATTVPDRFVVLDLPRNCGKAEAVRQGLQRALQFDPSYVGYWDADLATPLDAIYSFKEVLDHQPHIEAVIGSRIPLRGRNIARNPWRAKLGQAFALAASLVIGFQVRDTQCGAKLFRVSEQLAVVLDQPFSSRWIFDVELINRLTAIHGKRFANQIYELPLNNWFERPGSKLRPKHFIQAIAELGSIYWHHTGSRLRDYQVQALASLINKRRGEQWNESELEQVKTKAA